MNIQLESYAQEILNSSRASSPGEYREITKIKEYNVFHQNIEGGATDTDEVSEKKPIQKTQAEIEEMFGNIIESECILVDKKANGSYYSLTPISIELIKFCNNRILRNKKNPNASNIKCNFDIKVIDNNGKINITESAKESLYALLYSIFADTIPFQLCTNISDFNILLYKVLQIKDGKSTIVSECKLHEYNYQTNTGDLLSLSHRERDVVKKAIFIEGLYKEFCLKKKPFYISELKKKLRLILLQNNFSSVSPLEEVGYFYLSNPINNSSLYFAVAKYLCILSNVNRDYPPSNKLHTMSSILRLAVATFMLKNRYMCVNVLGTIEQNTEYSTWMTRKNNDLKIYNHEVFDILLTNLHIKHNQGVFNNPTSYSINELINMFESQDSQLDNFTKYCILMAQNLGTVQAFKTETDTLVTLEFNTGVSELISLALLLKRSIVCLSSNKMEDSHYKYIIGTGQSYYVTKQNMPILLHFREHYEIIWPEFHGRPIGVKHPPNLRDSEVPPFKYNATHNERLDPISVDTPEIPLELESFDLNKHLKESFVSSIEEPLVPYLKSQWDINGTIPVKREVLADINPENLLISEPHKADKKIFTPTDLIQIGNFNYKIKYITKDTPIISKGFVTQSELQGLLNDINSKKRLDKTKPIKIIAQNTISGKHTYRHHNFLKNEEDRAQLKKLLMNKDISVIKPDYDDQIIGSDKIKQNISLRCNKHILYGDYYYTCDYLSPPLVHKYKTPTKKQILRELKQSKLVKYKRPIKIIENWDDVSPHISYGIFINGEDDDDIEFQQHIDNGNIKVLEPLNIVNPKYVKEDDTSHTCEIEMAEDNSIDIRSDESDTSSDEDVDEDAEILIQPDDIIEKCDTRDKESDIKVIRFDGDGVNNPSANFRNIRQRKIINEDDDESVDDIDGEYEDTNITPNILHSASYFNSKSTSKFPMNFTKRRPTSMREFNSSKASKGDVLNVIVNDDVSEEFLIPGPKKIKARTKKIKARTTKIKSRTAKIKSVKKTRTLPQTKKIIRSKGRKDRIKKSTQKKIKSK